MSDKESTEPDMAQDQGDRKNAQALADIAPWAAQHARVFAGLNLDAALDKANALVTQAELSERRREIGNVLDNSKMLLFSNTGEALLLFHGKKPMERAKAVLNGLPSLITNLQDAEGNKVQQSTHVAYEHREPAAAMVGRDITALKIGPQLVLELSGMTQPRAMEPGTTVLPLKIKELQADQGALINEYRNFSREIPCARGA